MKLWPTFLVVADLESIENVYWKIEPNPYSGLQGLAKQALCIFCDWRDWERIREEIGEQAFITNEKEN